MARRDDGHDHARLERCPAATAVVEHELKHAVTVGDAERCAVQAGCSCDGTESSADVWVEHGEVELDVVQSRVRRPSALGIVPGDMGFECLWYTMGQQAAFIVAGRGDNARCFR